MALKLHYFPLSGHAHRVQLFLSLLGVEAEIETVDLPQRAHKAPEFLKLNPFGQVPVLEDDGVVISDSNAILVYLARKHGRAEWLPEDPAGQARVQQWLSVAAGQLAFGPAAARRAVVFGAKLDCEEAIARAHALFALMETELASGAWLAAQRPTIADVAMYSYVVSAPEGNVDLGGYPNISAWLARIEALDGFVPFQQTAVGLRAAS
ncbi:MAG: glutathione S-transferase family protein [Rhodobacteraceae bacterium]|nr:glutathione S-transferase family protein [Paracoccaceae bacterium]